MTNPRLRPPEASISAATNSDSHPNSLGVMYEAAKRSAADYGKALRTNRILVSYCGPLCEQNGGCFRLVYGHCVTTGEERKAIKGFPKNGTAPHLYLEFLDELKGREVAVEVTEKGLRIKPAFVQADPEVRSILERVEGLSFPPPDIVETSSEVVDVPPRGVDAFAEVVDEAASPSLDQISSVLLETANQVVEKGVMAVVFVPACFSREV